MRLVDADELYKLPCVHGAEGTWLCLEDIRNIPTADAEPVKHGHWLKTGQSFVNPNKFRNYLCSVCGLELDEHIRSKPNYCPNCGAIMTLD